MRIPSVAAPRTGGTLTPVNDIDVWTLVVMSLAVLVGAAVQSLVGIGLGLVAAPLIALAAPDLMPGSLLILALVLPLLSLVQGEREIDWHGFAWALPGRLVGTVVGVWVVTVVEPHQLGVAVGLVVLAATALTVRAFVVPINRATLNTAGFASGVVGTTSAIGGPPMALLYQHRPARQMRSTMAMFFLTGVSMSLIGLLVSGQLTEDQVMAGALLLPALLLGLALSSVLSRHLDAATIRPLVLAISAISAIVLIVRSLA